MRTLVRVAVVAVLGVLATVANASAATPIAQVVGPLPADAGSHPFGGAGWELQPEDLRAHGYVEEEYLVSGTANVYDWNAANQAIVRTGGVPYTTRTFPLASRAVPSSSRRFPRKRSRSSS